MASDPQKVHCLRLSSAFCCWVGFVPTILSTHPSIAVTGPDELAASSGSEPGSDGNPLPGNRGSPPSAQVSAFERRGPF